MKKDTVKYKHSPLKGKRKLEYNSKGRPSVKLPLIGKTVYLDVKEVKHLKRLQHDLRRLGGTIEEFLSKDINYLITTQPRPKQRKNAGCEGNSPIPSPFNCDPSPSPSNTEDRKVPTVTRGKALAEKARVKARESNNLLDNAEKWGVRIVSLEGAYKWIERELKKLPKQSHSLVKKPHKNDSVAKYKLFKAPFLKIEASNFYYRPLHHQLETWPRLNVDTPKGSCPFDGTLIKGGEQSMEERGDLLAAQVDIPSEDTPKEEKDGLGFDSNTPKLTGEKSTKKSELESVGGSRILTAGEIRRQKEIKRKLERKRGYCECCQVKYEDLDKHVRDEQHRAYIKDKSHYQNLDQLIHDGPSAVQFISGCLAKAVSLRNKKPNQEGEDEEVALIGDSPLKVTSPAKGKQPSVSKSHQPHQVNDSDEKRKENSVKCKENKVTDSKERHEKTKKVLKETNCSQEVVTVQCVHSNTSGSKTLLTYSELSKRTSPRKSLKGRIRDSQEPVREETVENAGNCSHLSPRRKSLGVQEKENKADIVQDAIKGTQDTPVEDTKSRITKSSPKANRCLSVLFDQENKAAVKQKSETSKGKLTSNAESGNIHQSSREVEMVKKHAQKSTTNNSESVERKTKLKANSVEFKNGKSSSKSTKAKLRNAGRDPETDGKVLSSAEVENTDLNNTKKEKSKSSKPVDRTTKNRNEQDQATAVTEVKTMMDICSKRVNARQSSDDFEVCLMRSIQKVQTDTEHNDNIKSKDREKTDKNSTKDTDVNVKKKSKDDRNKANEREENKVKRKELTHSKNSSNTEIVEKDNSEKVKADSSVKDKERSENDENNSGKMENIFSDFQYLGPDGEIHVFTKSLAERIKERSRSRPLSDTSFNLDSSYSIPRSNSVGSLHGGSIRNSDKALKKSKSVVSSKKNSQASIASRKVLTKYRARRDTYRRYEASQTGYQGDDERDVDDQRTMRSRETKNVKNPSKNNNETTFAINDQRDEHCELLKITKKGSKVIKEQEHDKKGNEDDKAIGKPNRKSKKSGKFWYYVAETVEEEMESESEKNRAEKDSYDKSAETKTTRTAKSRAIAQLSAYDQDLENFQKVIVKDSDFKAELADSRKKRTRPGKFWHYVTETVEEEMESESEKNQAEKDSYDKSAETKTTRTAKSRAIAQLSAYDQDSENFQKVIVKDSDFKAELADSRKKRTRPGKFWHYVTETVEEEMESESEKNQAEKDSYDKSAETKTTRTAKSRAIAQLSAYDQDSENFQKVIVKDSDFKAELADSRKKRTRPGKFWHYVTETVEEEMESESEKNQAEKDSYDKSAETKTTRTAKSRAIAQLSAYDQGSENFPEVIVKDSDLKAELGDSRRKHTRFSYYEPEIVSSEKDTDTELDDSNKLVKEQILGLSKGRKSRNCERDSGFKAPECKSDKQTKTKAEKKSGKASKFWYYEPELVDSNKETEEEVEILPVKLRNLKGRRDSSVDMASDSDTKPMSKQSSRAFSKSQTDNKATDNWLGESDSREIERSSSANRKALGENIDGKDDIGEGGNAAEKIKKKKHKKSKDIQKSKKSEIKSDTEIVKKKRERSKFWEYVSFIESETDDVDPSLPKKLQILKSPWNNLVDQSDLDKPRRSRNNSLDRRQSDKYQEIDTVGEDCNINKEKQTKNNAKIHQRLKTTAVSSVETSPSKCAGMVSVDMPVTISSERNNEIEDETTNKEVHLKKLESSKILITNVSDKDVSNSTDKIESENETTSYSKKILCLSSKNSTRVGRSSSPKFHKKSKFGKRPTEQRQEKRRASPVFPRSPPSKRRKECDEASEPVSNEASASESAVCQDNVKNSAKGVKSPLKSGRVDSALHSSVNASDTSPVKTPTKKINIEPPKSGYSNTPRENRRKRWKRKRSSDKFDKTSQNSEVSDRDKKKRKLEKLKYELGKDSGNESSTAEIREKKKRRLEKLKYELGKDSGNDFSSPEMREKKKDLLVKINQALVNNTEDKSPGKVVKNRLEPRLEENSKLSDSNVETVECSNNGDENIKSFPLLWEPSAAQKSGRFVKLNHRWSMLSDRSVSKLLSSEDDRESFDGFTQEEVEKDIPSDLSYYECSEVGVAQDSEHDWVIDKHGEKIENENSEKDEFVKYLPPTFSSPGKRSDSSWLDACEDYIDKSLKKDPKDSSFNYSLTSPWRSPVKKAKVSNKQSHRSRECSTPKKKSANTEANVEKVDKDIEFNFSSPQKRRGEFSPLRYKNGRVIDTSTPHPERSHPVKPSHKSTTNYVAEGNYSGLRFTGDEEQADVNISSKEFKLLKKVSSNTKKYSLTFDIMSPTKKKKNKKSVL